MLAYSNDSVIKFRDEKTALPTNLRGWDGEKKNEIEKEKSSWNLTCEASSSEEENEDDQDQNDMCLSPVSWIQQKDESVLLEHDGYGGSFEGNFNNKNQENEMLGLELGLDDDDNGNGGGDGCAPLLSIYPAEHNTIVQAENQISQPWASLFRNYEAFNAVQSACFNVAACSDENLIVSAPTGCGKTVLFEFAILRLLSARKHQNAKVVILCPIRALCQERVSDWSSRFGELGIKVIELSGDVGKPDIKEVSSAQIICTTPEKWDSITRRWTEHIYLLGKVQLLLVDEIHNIGDSRGATMEAVICRMKSVSKSAAVTKYGLPSADLRIVALSATLPNLECIGEFIEAKPENILNFDSKFRPVPLTVHVNGYPPNSSDFWFEKNLEKKVADVIKKYGAGRPSLIFCGSRKSTETTCDLIAQVTPKSKDPILLSSSKQAINSKLGEALLCGIAFHHANLQSQDRSLVERLYRDRKILALCCTSSLAMGVNLPAHLVIIKSTAQWQGKGSGYCQMANSNILQMIGRAGRPGLDDHGVAVIMTDETHRAHYEKISTGCEIIESKLHEDLVETLNAEIGNNVVQSIEDAANWIRSTFLFTRLKKNPLLYGLKVPYVPPGQKPKNSMDSIVLEFLHDKIRTALHELTSTNIVEFDGDGIVISPLKPSHIMSRQMLSLDTMKVVLSIGKDINIEEMLLNLSKTKEVTHELRHGQKKQLKDLNSNVRFKLPKSKKFEVIDKTFLQFQGALGRLVMEDPTLSREQNSMIEQAGRILTAIIDHCLDNPISFGKSLLSATILRRNFKLSCWENQISELYQFDDLIPNSTLIKKLESFGFATIRSLAEGSPMAIESCIGKKSPFGNKLVQSSRRILSQSLCIIVNIGNENENNENVKLDILKPVEINIVKKHSYQLSYNEMLQPNEKVSYTLIAYTLTPANVLFGPKSSAKHGIHLFRKVTSVEKILLPLSASKAVSESTLFVALISNKIGLDDSINLTVSGAMNTEEQSHEISSSSTTAAKNKKLPITAIDGSIDGKKSLSDSLDGANEKTAFLLDIESEDQVVEEVQNPSKPKSTTTTSATTSHNPKSTSTANKKKKINSNKIDDDLAKFEYQEKPFNKIEVKGNNKSNYEKASQGQGHGTNNVQGIQGSNQSKLPFISPPKDLPTSSGLSRKSTVGVRNIKDGMRKGTLGTLRQKAQEMDLFHNVRSSRLSSSNQLPTSTSAEKNMSLSNNTNVTYDNVDSKESNQYQNSNIDIPTSSTYGSQYQSQLSQPQGRPMLSRNISPHEERGSFFSPSKSMPFFHFKNNNNNNNQSVTNSNHNNHIMKNNLLNSFVKEEYNGDKQQQQQQQDMKSTRQPSSVQQTNIYLQNQFNQRDQQNDRFQGIASQPSQSEVQSQYPSKWNQFQPTLSQQMNSQPHINSQPQQQLEQARVKQPIEQSSSFMRSFNKRVQGGKSSSNPYSTNDSSNNNNNSSFSNLSAYNQHLQQPKVENTVSNQTMNRRLSMPSEPSHTLSNARRESGPQLSLSNKRTPDQMNNKDKEWIEEGGISSNKRGRSFQSQETYSQHNKRDSVGSNSSSLTHQGTVNIKPKPQLPRRQLLVNSPSTKIDFDVFF